MRVCHNLMLAGHSHQPYCFSEQMPNSTAPRFESISSGVQCSRTSWHSLIGLRELIEQGSVEKHSRTPASSSRARHSSESAAAVKAKPSVQGAVQGCARIRKHSTHDDLRRQYAVMAAEKPAPAGSAFDARRSDT